MSLDLLRLFLKKTLLILVVLKKMCDTLKLSSVYDFIMDDRKAFLTFLIFKDGSMFDFFRRLIELLKKVLFKLFEV